MALMNEMTKGFGLLGIQAPGDTGQSRTVQIEHSIQQFLETVSSGFSVNFPALYLVKDNPSSSEPSIEILGSNKESGHSPLIEKNEILKAIEGEKLPLIKQFSPSSDSIVFVHGIKFGGDGALLFCCEVLGDSEKDTLGLQELFEKKSGTLIDGLLILQQEFLIESLKAKLETAEEVLFESNIEIEDALDSKSPSEVDSRQENIIGITTSSPVMKRLLQQMIRVSSSHLNILLKGETGTGKAFLARAFHESSPQSGQPFETLGCGSLSTTLAEGELFGWKKGAFSGAEEDRAGIFERSSGGTVFLDEVGELPLEIQKKLLRVLQEGVVRPVGGTELVPVDCRIIASTCEDLPTTVLKGSFREDLFYRLSGFNLEIPPLRERKEDVSLLVSSFLAELEEEHGFSKRFSNSAWEELYSCTWPGNIQQLKNVVQQTYLTCERRMIPRKKVLEVFESAQADKLLGDNFEDNSGELVMRVPRTEGFNEIISEVERLVILTAMKQHRGNKSRVTKQLKIPRQTLYNKIERFKIVEEEYQ